jgi:hypothetical protein
VLPARPPSSTLWVKGGPTLGVGSGATQPETGCSAGTAAKRKKLGEEIILAQRPCVGATPGIYWRKRTESSMTRNAWL